MREAAFSNDFQVSELFTTNSEIVFMRQPFGLEWMSTNANAFAAYEHGDWKLAINLFHKVLEMKPEDKPTKNILAFMQQHDNIPPADWQGFKFFDE